MTGSDERIPPTGFLIGANAQVLIGDSSRRASTSTSRGDNQPRYLRRDFQMAAKAQHDVARTAAISSTGLEKILARFDRMELRLEKLEAPRVPEPDPPISRTNLTTKGITPRATLGRQTTMSTGLSSTDDETVMGISIVDEALPAQYIGAIAPSLDTALAGTGRGIDTWGWKSPNNNTMRTSIPDRGVAGHAGIRPPEHPVVVWERFALLCCRNHRHSRYQNQNCSMARRIVEHRTLPRQNTLRAPLSAPEAFFRLIQTCRHDSHLAGILASSESSPKPGTDTCTPHFQAPVPPHIHNSFSTRSHRCSTCSTNNHNQVTAAQQSHRPLLLHRPCRCTRLSNDRHPAAILRLTSVTLRPASNCPLM